MVDESRTSIRRRRLLQAAGASGVAGLAGCSALSNSTPTETNTKVPDTPSPTPEQNLVKVGVLAPAPDRGPIGRSLSAGAKVALNELNNNTDDSVEFQGFVRDTKGSIDKTRAAYRDLVHNQNVDVTVGIFRSEILLGIMDEIGKTDVPHLSAGSATTKASQYIKKDYNTYKNHFRVGPLNTYYLGVSVVDMFKRLNGDAFQWDKVAFLGEDYQWTANVQDAVKGAAEATGGIEGETDATLVDSVRYPPDTQDFSSYYDKFANKDVDGVIPAMTTSGSAAIVQWTKSKAPFGMAGIHVPMQLPSYYKAINGACRYAVGQGFGSTHTPITKKTVPFVNAFEKMHGFRPVYTGFHAYDAITLFAKKLEETGTTDPASMIPALEDTSFLGTVGTIEFYGRDARFPHDPVYGDEQIKPVYFQWQESDGVGKQEILWPDKHATAEYKKPGWLQ